MSVTFSPSMDTNVAHVLVCMCGEWNSGVVYPSFEMAHMMHKEVQSSCTDPYCDYLYVEAAIAEPEVQMSNSNAVQLLDVLGIGVDSNFSDRCSGVLSAEDFLGRVLIAQGVNPSDAGTETITVGNMVDCGRPEGYIDAKLDAMRGVAEWAIANGRTITWG